MQKSFHINVLVKYLEARDYDLWCNTKGCDNHYSSLSTHTAITMFCCLILQFSSPQFIIRVGQLLGISSYLPTSKTAGATFLWSWNISRYLLSTGRWTEQLLPAVNTATCFLISHRLILPDWIHIVSPKILWHVWKLQYFKGSCWHHSGAKHFL